MALIPQSNDPGSLVGAGERGTNDKLTLGFDGLSYLLGDAGTIIDGAGGNDRLYGYTLIGDALAMSGSARGGNDRLYGGVGPDLLVGDASTMSGSARGGNDRLYGGDGDNSFFGDALVGDASTMSGSARGGNDVLDGGDGSAGADFLRGDASLALTSLATDVLTAGDDLLRGAGGEDFLWGDFEIIVGPGTVQLGRDVFAFGAASGQDLVLDFQQGLDRLDVRGAGLTADEFATHVAGNVVDLEGGNGVTVTTLAGAPVALALGDFLFA